MWYLGVSVAILYDIRCILRVWGALVRTWTESIAPLLTHYVHHIPLEPTPCIFRHSWRLRGMASSWEYTRGAMRRVPYTVYSEALVRSRAHVDRIHCTFTYPICPPHPIGTHSMYFSSKVKAESYRESTRGAVRRVWWRIRCILRLWWESYPFESYPFESYEFCLNHTRFESYEFWIIPVLNHTREVYDEYADPWSDVEKLYGWRDQVHVFRQQDPRTYSHEYY